MVMQRGTRQMTSASAEKTETLIVAFEIANEAMAEL
jgi:hypothetical protein